MQLLLVSVSLQMNIKYMLVSGAEVGENVCRKNANYLLAVLPFSAEKEQGDDA